MILTAARSLRPSDVARRRRTARRAAHGFSRPALARAENLPEAEVERLLAAPDFQGLVAAYRHLASLPEAEQVAHLAPSPAWCSTRPWRGATCAPPCSS